MATGGSGVYFTAMVYFYSTSKSTSNSLKYGVRLRLPL
jgi:hypothetical protein